MDQDGWSAQGRPMPGCWDPWPGNVKASIRAPTGASCAWFHIRGKFPLGSVMPAREGRSARGTVAPLRPDSPTGRGAALKLPSVWVRLPLGAPWDRRSEGSDQSQIPSPPAPRPARRARRRLRGGGEVVHGDREGHRPVRALVVGGAGDGWDAPPRRGGPRGWRAPRAAGLRPSRRWTSTSTSCGPLLVERADERARGWARIAARCVGAAAHARRASGGRGWSPWRATAAGHSSGGSSSNHTTLVDRIRRSAELLAEARPRRCPGPRRRRWPRRGRSRARRPRAARARRSARRRRRRARRPRAPRTGGSAPSRGRCAGRRRATIDARGAASASGR